ncbi:sensor histidine kinase [Dyadobacter luticola]|uniref:GHKL domain-containing protein n=1 Tax=Dyadobacter luticola TaxID=1979387 RepID=A0A5R9KYW4_9BACT|nr:histidine kinase [Dyadobacter luticola]TLV01464.1 GHKL domain-containing protein [Dyadobacter luticola]
MTFTRNSRLALIAFHTLLWSIYLLLPYAVSSAASGYKIGVMPGLFFTLAGLIHLVIFYVNAYVMYPRWLNQRFWWLYLLASVGLIMLSFRLKYQLLTSLFPEVLQASNAEKFVFGPSVAFFFLSIIYRNILNQLHAQRQLARQQSEQLRAELMFLRSQISPHFLFNVLTNLISLARQKSDKLESSLLMLSDLMRYILYDVNGRKITLAQEIDYLRSYIDLQKLRFGSDVPVTSEIEIDPGAYTSHIEPMLLIPLVENAFKHGVNVLENPEIHMYLFVKNGRLVFHVKNRFDVKSINLINENQGIGLANLRARLDLLYKNSHTLLITNTNNWFDVTLILDLL